MQLEFLIEKRQICVIVIARCFKVFGNYGSLEMRQIKMGVLLWSYLLILTYLQWNL